MDSNNIHKPYLRLLPVQVAAVLIGSVNALVDTVITSRFLGESAVAGVGFFSPMLNVISLCYVILNGTQILCGRAVGKGEKKEVTTLFSTAFVTLLGYGLFLALTGFIFRNPLAALSGARGDSEQYLRDYLAGFMPGVPFMMLSSQTMMFLPGNNEIKRSYCVMGVMVVSNAALDVLAIRILNMGTFGLGMATTLSYLLSLMISMPCFLRKDKAYRIDLSSIRIGRMKEAFRLGLPLLAFNLGITLRSYIINLSVMSFIGTAGVAVLNVQNTVLSFLGAVPQGNGNAYTILASIYYGEKDRFSLKKLTSAALKTGIGITCCLLAVIVIASPLIASLFFVTGTETNQLAQQMLYCLSSVWLWSAVFVILTRGFQIQNYLKTVNILNFLEQVFTAAIAAVGIRLIGVTAVWISCPAADLLCLLMILILIRHSLGRMPRTVDEWIRLPADFGAREEDVLEFGVSCMDEVTSVSVRIMDFCRKKGIDTRRTTIAGLSVEEMAGNVIAHGIQAGKQNHIEIRIVAEEQLTIRIRDDCRAFDPTQRINQYYPEDPAKNVGIRMIGKLAAEMDYHNEAGINTLLIKI